MVDVIPGVLERDRAAVEALLRACAEADGVQPAFCLDAPGDPALTTSFGVEAGGRLVGVAYLPADPPEAGLAVHPACRRRGIGRALLAAVADEARRRGMAGLLLVANTGSANGEAFLRAVGAVYETSEYRLELTGEPPAPDRPHPGLSLRPATPADAGTVVRIRAAAFGDDFGETLAAVERRMTEPNRRYRLGLLDGEPVGVLCLGAWGNEADVTAFGVLPAYQGRGYGRQLLLEAVAQLRREGWARIAIEVETDNARALGLYEACGFAVAARFAYWRLALERGKQDRQPRTQSPAMPC